MSSQMPFFGRTRGEIVNQIMEGCVLFKKKKNCVFSHFHYLANKLHLSTSKYEYKGRRWKRISKAGKAFIDDLLVVDPDDRATDDEALKASWLNRRYSATIRNPKMEEMNLAKDSVLRYAKYSKIRQMALMGTCDTHCTLYQKFMQLFAHLFVPLHFFNTKSVVPSFSLSPSRSHCPQINECRNWYFT